MKIKTFIVVIILMTFAIVAPAQITSVQSGNWSDSDTWDNGVPTSSDDVVIAAGHTVTVDAEASCKDISFGDNTAKLGLNDDLKIYGDFNVVDTYTSNNPFNDSGSLWTAGKKLIFYGDAETQTFNGLTSGSSSSSTNIFCVNELVVNKSSGKFTTGGTSSGSNDYFLGIGTSLEVINGTFELGYKDDLEGRTVEGSAASPTITIYEGGIFTTVGSYSHIRRGTNSSEDSKKIGKVIIYGSAYLGTGSSNLLNFDGIDVEDGGEFIIETGRGYTENCLNPGTVTIKSGGTISNSLITDIWYVNSTTPTTLVINDGGVFETTSSTTSFPPNITNNGSVLYARTLTSSDQTIVDMDYHDLEFRYAESSTKKNWTLGANRVISGEFTNCYSAEAVITADAAYTLTIGGTLRLTSGSVDNSDAEVTIEMADGATISRATGTITNAPTLTGTVDVLYWSTSTSVTTGAELPSQINDLTVIISDQTVTLDKSIQVNGDLTISSGTIDEDVNTVTIADGASIRRASGELSTVPTFLGIKEIEYISTSYDIDIGNEIPADGIIDKLILSGDEDVTLTKNITVNNSVELSGGTLKTGSFKLIIGESATLTEPAGNTIIGNVQTTRTLSQSTNNTFGGIGVEINAAGAAPGATTVLRTTGTASTGGDNQGIKRWFDITPGTNTGLNATLVFHYDDSELNDLSESSLVLYKSDNDGSIWSPQGGSVNTDNNTITLSGISDFSRWTAGETGDNSLPVTLESFSAKVTESGVDLSWSTASELENQGFVIYRAPVYSENESDIEEMVSYLSEDDLLGQGSTSSTTDYTYTDSKVVSGMSYVYYLADVDYAGKETIHKDKKVMISIPADAIQIANSYKVKMAYPNPFNAALTIPFELNEAMYVSISIYDINGRVVSNIMNNEMQTGRYSIHYNASNLSSGIYFVRFNIGAAWNIQRIVLLK